MFANNEVGLYPSVLFHRSHRGQLAIGGAMLNRFHDGEEDAEIYEATPVSGGWRTRFDGGRTTVQDLPCDLVAMYVEGLCHIDGYEGAWDWEVETQPACYAVVVFRWNESVKEQRVYLQSQFSFASRVWHDGVYDLKNAFDVATQKGNNCLTFELLTRWSAGYTREWHLVPKAHVPGRIRQILHKTVKTMEVVIDHNFGQGKKFFQLPERRK